MSVTVRRRVARFDAGGTMAPSSPLLGNPSSGSSGATPSATPTPTSTSGSFGGGMAIGAGPSAASYTPGSGGTWSNGGNGAIPQQSDGITATAQGLPAATAKQGQYSSGAQSSQAGSWGGAATNPSGTAVTGQQSNSGTYTPYTPGSYQRAGTAGNYGAYQVAPTAPTSGVANTPQLAVAVAQGGAIPAPSMAEGGAVKNYAGAGSISFISHKGRHGGGGMTQSQANNDAYNAQEERQNEQLAQQSHQHDMQDESQLVPGSFQKKSSQQAAPQKQQSQKPQRAAGPSSNQQATQQMQSSANQLENSLLGQQRQRDNTQMQSLQKEMNQGASPNGSSGSDPSQDSGQSQPDDAFVGPQQTSPNTPDSSGEVPADNSASDGSASAGGMRKGGPVKFDDGGAVPAPSSEAPDPSQETTAGAFDQGGSVPGPDVDQEGNDSPQAEEADADDALKRAQAEKLAGNTGNIMSEEGGLGVATGGAIPASHKTAAKFGSIADGGTPTTGGHPATAGVKAAFSHARKMNGLNDQVFQQMASGLSGMQQKMEDGGAVENPDDPDGVQVGADDDDKNAGFDGGGAVPTPADTEVDNQEGPSNDPMDNEADRQQEAQADNALQAAGDPAGAEGTNFLKAAARSDPALKNEAAFPGNAG